MRSPDRRILALAVCAAFLVPLARPQHSTQAEVRAREYVQFLVLQLDQWTRDFPQAYNMAMMRPPVDATRLSEDAKAGAANLREAVTRLSQLSNAQDLMQNVEFKNQIAKTISAAGPMNQALGAQRFPEAVQSDWAPIRTTLNSLGDIYKVPLLAVLEPPVPGGKDKAGAVVAAIPAGAVTGFVVDQRCAKAGKAMWVDVKCVQKCVRDGDKVVLVTEQGKVFQISNQEKIDGDSYGQRVAITGKTEGDVITVSALQIL